MIISWFIYFQLLSLLLAIWFYRGLNHFKLTGFLILLPVVCITELASARLISMHQSNYSIYNYYLLASTPVTMYIFLKMLNYKGWLRALYTAISILLVSFIVLNFLFLQGPRVLNNYSIIMIEFITAVLSLLVLSKLFRDDDFIRLDQHPYFWISGSTLIFSGCTIILLGLQQFIDLKKVIIDGKNIYRVIMPILNVVLYTSYSYAFFLCKRLTGKL